MRTWFDYYYPTEAYSDEAQADPVRHSLRKWRGLRKKIREKHGLRSARPHTLKSTPYLILQTSDDCTLEVRSGTCALCIATYPAGVDHSKSHFVDCEACPIVKATGQACMAQWEEFIQSGNAEPMVELLERTKKWQDAQK